MNKSIFRKTSLDRVSSPEQLNDYIRVSNPSIWLILGAVAALLIALFVWAIWGDLPTNKRVSGYAEGGVVVCYIDAAEIKGIEPGKQVECENLKGVVTEVGDKALSYEEVSTRLGGDEYMLYALNVGQWSIPVTMEIAGAPDEVVSVSVTTESISPIDFLLN